MIKWNEVTWYSKLLAGIFLLGVFPALTFYIGMQYEKTTDAYEDTPATVTFVQENKIQWDLSPSVEPAKVGQCVSTQIAKIGTRLVDGITGESFPDSGSQIEYMNGVSQVSYETIPEIERSHINDPITLCLISLPQNCPPGDNRGKQYSAKNMRTGETWTLSDSQHGCGGA